MKEVDLKIEGMHCDMCESHICDCIRKGVPQAKKVKANHIKGTASFVVDDDIDYSKAIESIKKDGYKVLSYDANPYVKKGLFSFLHK